jgi:phosphoglycerol transferase MdoB-like AlkP superfamily enzyme
MSIPDVRHARYYIAALGARLARPSWRTAPLAILHGAAIAVIAFTETTPTSIALFLLTWGILVSFWLLLLRRPAVAAALSLILVVAVVVLSSFKYDIVYMTVDFLDVMLIDFGTIRFLLTIYPDLRAIVVALLVVTVLLTVLLWRFDPYRVGRRASALGLAACCAGLIALSITAPGDWWEVFAGNNFVSKFSRSTVAAVEEFLKHGLIEADAHAAGGLPEAQAMPCNPAARLPHVILVHDESSVDIRIAPDIKVPQGYGTHFRSFDGKARRLLVESFGGASWYSEFAVLTGLSSRSFGRFAYSLPRIAAGRVNRGLPLELRRCGYRTYSFYSASSAFMSAKSFQMSTGIENFVDNRAMGTTQVEPDSFYYDTAMTMLRREHGSGPLFAFVYLAANHFPFTRSWHPDLMPGWRDPGNTPAVDEYLRRQARSVQDYQTFLDRLKREFPGEPFLLIRYGDHQPAFPTFVMDPALDKATIARRMQAHDPRYFTTYYAVDTINYQPADVSMALETLDAPYIPLVIQQMIGLPLSPSFVEQRKIFERCSGIFYACAGGAEVRRFNRLLLDSGQLSRL